MRYWRYHYRQEQNQKQKHGRKPSTREENSAMWEEYIQMGAWTRKTIWKEAGMSKGER